jgi:hypothetical protein
MRYRLPQNYDCLQNSRTKAIRKALENKFHNVAAYTYGPGAIRIRAIDDVFAGKGEDARLEILEDALSVLPEVMTRDVYFMRLYTIAEATEAQQTESKLFMMFAKGE